MFIIVSSVIPVCIDLGAGWLSWGLSKGAELTVNLVRQGADHLQRNIKPNETPSKVDPTVEKGIYYTHQVTSKN